MQITANEITSRQIKILVTWLFMLTGIVILMVKGTWTTPDAQTVGQVYSWQEVQNVTDIKQVQALNQSRWQSVENPVNLGMSKSAYWLKVKIYPNNLVTDFSLFEINYPLLDSVDIWFFEAETSSNAIAQFSVGDTLPFEARPYLHETFVFDFGQFDTLPQYAYIRVASQGSLKVPMRLWQPQKFTEFVGSQRIAMGLFFGVLGAMALSNFFFFLTTRTFTFFIYTGYVLSVTAVLAALFGYGHEYLWPKTPWLQERAIAIFANAAIMFAVFFTNSLLELPAYNKRLGRFIQGLGVLFFVNVLISFFAPYYYLIQVFLVLLLFVVAVVFGLCIWLSLRNISIARYYTFAWLVLLVSAFAAGLDNLHIVELPVSSSALILYGALAETLLLALVLAISYGTQREALEQAQQLAVEREKEMAAAKDKLLAVEQEAKDDLEYKVQERTLELEITLRELSEANQELERLNTIDPLTGIRNRRHFDKRLIAEGRRSRREQTNLCLVMMDIDHFKRVNDDYGHDVGDACIKHVAGIAKGLIKRPSDDICRYGGEEFAFILPNTSLEGAAQFIDSIRTAIETSPCQTDTQAVTVTVSAGVASAPVTSDEGEKHILKAADQALYLAKQKGRNRVMVAEQSEN